MKKRIKMSCGVRWTLLKLNMVNFFKIVFRLKIKKSNVLKRLLKKILKENEPSQIPQTLQEKGFFKLDENEINPTIEDFINATNLATVSILKNKQEWELSIYDDVAGFEDTLLINYVQIAYDKNQVTNARLVGTYVDKTFSHQLRIEKIREFILRFSLVN